MQSGGGNPMNAAQLARLQQQLAQYGRGNGQQQMMNPNAMGGMGNQQSQQQQLQQAFMQQQLQQNQGNQGGMVRRNSALGMNSNSAAALAMMQQQQQQVAAGGSQMANANMSSYWNALQNQSSGGAMDASSASSAQLAALAGMNMNTNNISQTNAANMLLGNRSSQPQQAPQVQGLLGNQPKQGGMGQTTDANLLQQQIAQLQRQLQQQQQQQNQQPNQGMNMQGGSGMDRRNSNGFGGMQGSQQQLYQQMQQQMATGMMGQDGMSMGQNKMGNDQFGSMNNMMQGQNSMQNMLGMGGQSMMSANSRGTLNEQDLLLQQQQLLRGSGMSQTMQNDTQKVQDMFGMGQQNNQDLMGQRRTAMQNPMDQSGMGISRQGQGNMAGGFNNSSMGFDMDGSMSSQRSASRPNQIKTGSPLDVSGQMPGDKGDGGNQKSFLDGSFAGGWQSNADLPDRRRIIFSILEVIRQMRPDTNKISQKLPHMAKSLEEHLYRSAQTKEEYLDPSTLKKRLQLIAHGLEIHRSTSSGSVGSHPSQNKPRVDNNQQGNVPSETHQLQQFLAMQQGNMNPNQQGMAVNNGLPGMGGNVGMQNAMPQIDMLQGLGGGMDSSMNSMSQSQNSAMLKGGDGSNYQDRIAAQKKKVIRQQQQRLLLLRHASKCKEGPNCKTKFCAQMMTLWKHMKKCRDKSCKTSHCLSSRCVLNHYRICKSQGRTSTCEVCGPVMEQIKRQDQEGSLDSSDPLAAKPDPDLPNQALPQLQQQMSGFGQGGNQNNVQAMQQQAMQQLFQQQQQALQQNQQGGMQNAQAQQMQQNNLQALGGGMSMNQMQPDALLRSQSGGNQLQGAQMNLQNAQQKLQQQQQVLRQLQKQQNQLLEQQKQLQEQQALLKDPNTQQAQQLQQQHQLLQQLQRRCQQQQALIQQELMLQMKTMEQGGQDMQSLQQQMGQTMDNNSQGSQLIGNSSQNSHHSHHSQNSNQMQQMQGMGQDQMQGMDDKSNMNAMNQLQNQMQNQMQNQSSSQEQQLLQMQQALNAQQQQQNKNIQIQSQQQVSDNSSPQQDDQDQADGASSNNDPLGNIPKPLSQPMSDNSERSANSKRRNSNKVRPKPVVGRGKGARGRGGKGKRLRDIADDLGSAGAPISATDATSMLSKKRSSSELGGGDDGPNKLHKGDGPLPDSEKSEKDVEDDKKDGEGESSSSLTSSLPKGDVEQHLLLLHKGLHLTSRTITHKCLPIVQQLIDDPFGWVFRDAVDPVVFGLPDYFEVVKNPMHLLLVKKKLENAVYTDMASFERDVKLVFENAILYNGEESEVGQLAQTMMGVFEREYKKVCEETRNELASIGPNDCSLCGLERRRFQSPVLYCVGMTCGMQKIKRNAIYYTKGSHQNIWCVKCYSKLKENEVIILDDGSETRKSRLHEEKNDSNPEETWVRCDGCEANVHQVCALTSDRIRNPEEKFLCPKCDLKNRKGFDLRPARYNRRAEDLQKCEMSDDMEAGLLKTLEAAYESKAKEMKIPLEEVEKATGICIRVLSHITKKHGVRDEMYNLYSKAGCPSDYPAHTKCVGLFQKINGVDVLLFAMYVYEYGHECPAPNRRRVYISYLDSVQYFEPPTFRTLAYQSVIIEYLRFVKKRGFHTAHIWSCPPTPGDEYVFYCHPSSQKIPQEEKLRNWYLDLLEKAKEDGIVVDMTNFYDEYFADAVSNAPGSNSASPMSLPYFEGDYIPGEIENILSNLSKEEKRNLPISAHPAPRRSGSKLGTRSNPGNLISQTQDKIMQKLGKAIFNMKENFMIVRLRSEAFAAAVDRGDDVSNWPEDEDSLPLIKGKDSSILGKSKQESSDGDDDDSGDDRRQTEMEQILSRAFATVKGPKIGDTIDKDPQFDSELFENRQLFLNYCQMNNCQFDDLRKAKHTTLMVLFQLHNPMVPKFFEQCGACYRDIAHGNRFHCNICPSYDLCDECYKPVTSGAWASRGRRYNHDSSHSFSRISLKESAEAKKSQAERAKSLQGYLEVLSHAANCPGAPMCKLNNCEKMKKLFVHVRTCELTYLKGCKVCHRLVSLIIVHARSCGVRGSCSLPFCDKIRERNERMRRQQQLMDDRRRQAQNTYYGAGTSP